MRKLLTQDEFIKKARKTHGDKYDYNKTVYVSLKEKVKIICPEHGEFEQRAGNHINLGRGCARCSKNKKYTTEEFIQKAKEIHGNKYDYSNIDYKNSRIKIKIFCKKCQNYFWQTPSAHLHGRGCDECGGTKTLTTEEFIQKAKEIHGNKYDYSKVNYINAHSEIKIICPTHGEFLQIPDVHLRGGCPRCSGCKKYTTEEFIQKAKEIHGNKYDYSKVNYINAYTNIIIICSTHGEFLQTPDHHINQKSGCKLCSNRISIGSQEYLDYNNIPIEYREKYINIPNFHKVFLDSFDPIKNEGREYDGDWWHGNPKIYNQNDIHPIAKITYGELYKRTLEKHAAIRSIGIKLVTIWESDWKKSSERKEYLKIKEK